MKKIVRSLVAGLALASSVFAVQSAHAADITRAHTITLSSETGSFGDTFNAGDFGKTFLDEFSFTLLSSSAIDAALVSVASLKKLDLAIDTVKLYFGNNLIANGIQEMSGKNDVWSLSHPTVGAGIYKLAVEGKVVGTNGGGFGGNLNVSPAPEPSTWGMMLGGFALLGFIARRRNTNSLAV